MPFADLASLHPIVWGMLAAALFVNAGLVAYLVRRWTHYRDAKRWPRIEVRADSVDLMRVMHNHVGQQHRREYHQAVLCFRYEVNGRRYEKRSVREVGSAEEAEALKADARISFLYNPERPEETLEQLPGPAPVVATLVGMLIVNGMLIGFAESVSRFLSGGAE